MRPSVFLLAVAAATPALAHHEEAPLATAAHFDLGAAAVILCGLAMAGLYALGKKTR